MIHTHDITRRDALKGLASSLAASGLTSPAWATGEGKSIVNVGPRTRYSAHVQRAMTLIREGAIGKVLQAKTWDGCRRISADSDEDFIDHDNFHELELALWGLGVEAQNPESVSVCYHPAFPDATWKSSHFQRATFDFAPADSKTQRKQLLCERSTWNPYHMEGYENGNAFYGTHGFLLLNSNSNFRLFNKDSDLIEEMQADVDGPTKTASDPTNTLCRLYQDPHLQVDLDLRQHSFTVFHLGNIATRLRRTLFFDGQKQQFINDDEANTLLTQSHRKDHWTSPT